MEEQTVWEGSPSQLVHLGTYVLCGLTFFLIVPLFVALWKWIDTRCRTYRVTTQRVIHARGVFSRITDELELYRVKDIRMMEPLLMRPFGVGNLVLLTSDRTSPDFVMPGVKYPGALLDLIRKHVELRRDEKRVRELDVD